MDTHALAWAAGFWDGEGCTGNQRYPNGAQGYTVFSLTQAGDEAVALLERFRAAVQIDGGIYPLTKDRTDRPRKPGWRLYIGGAQKVRMLLDRCRPWLSATKIAQAERALANWEASKAAFVHRNSLKTHCPYGHPYDEANTYRKGDGRRRCRACRMRMYNANPERARAMERARYQADPEQRNAVARQRYHAKKHQPVPVALALSDLA